VLIVFGLYLIVLKILFEKGFFFKKKEAFQAEAQLPSPAPRPTPFPRPSPRVAWRARPSALAR
jgi:hypothetical protein